MTDENASVVVKVLKDRAERLKVEIPSHDRFMKNHLELARKYERESAEAKDELAQIERALDSLTGEEATSGLAHLSGESVAVWTDEASDLTEEHFEAVRKWVKDVQSVCAPRKGLSLPEFRGDSVDPPMLRKEDVEAAPEPGKEAPPINALTKTTWA